MPHTQRFNYMNINNDKIFFLFISIAIIYAMLEIGLSFFFIKIFFKSGIQIYKKTVREIINIERIE